MWGRMASCEPVGNRRRKVSHKRPGGQSTRRKVANLPHIVGPYERSAILEPSSKHYAWGARPLARLVHQYAETYFSAE